jgi:hypothetical protein
MSAATYNILIEQNANFSISVTVQDGSGNPIDLTGNTIESQIREYPTGIIFDNFEINVTNASQGQFTLSLSASQTLALPVIGMEYDVLMTLSDGVTKQRLMEGKISISEPITQ